LQLDKMRTLLLGNITLNQDQLISTDFDILGV